MRHVSVFNTEGSEKYLLIYFFYLLLQYSEVEGIYVSPQIVTGPVLELGRPVLELGRSSPHTGTVPRRGAPYWNWIQDRGFVPKRGVQCWNWASSAGTGRLSCNPDLSPAPYWHWCQYGAPHFGRRIRVGGVWQFFLASEK